jgi:hypothetical protein
MACVVCYELAAGDRTGVINLDLYVRIYMHYTYHH